MVLASSFGKYSSALLHLTKQVIPNIKVLFIDTGFHSMETYLNRKNLEKSLNLDVIDYSARRSIKMQRVLYGDDLLSENNFERTRKENKIEPFDRGLFDLEVHACLSGVMRWESKERQDFQFVKKRGGVYMIYPILDWEEKDILQYIESHSLPMNNFYNDVFKGKDQKLECGLHEHGSGI